MLRSPPPLNEPPPVRERAPPTATTPITPPARARVLYTRRYAVDPSGDAIQLDADWGTDAPAWYGSAADDALQNLCTQGNCSVAVTTAACSAALAAECAGLGAADAAADINACADCVHWRWGALAAAGCYNPDTVLYCVGV